MNNTKEIIRQRALELFNEKGVEYGGMRELAALLNMRVSNITYYFATKDDLVGELMARLAEANNNTVQKYKTSSLKDFLEMYNELFHNQYTYKCLFMSFVHLFTHHKQLAESYTQIEKKRKQKLADTLNNLMAHGYLKPGTDTAGSGKLVAHISLIARFWISESIVSYYHKSTEEVIRHYLELLCGVFIPYATAKGKKEIDVFLKNIAAT